MVDWKIEKSMDAWRIGSEWIKMNSCSIHDNYMLKQIIPFYENTNCHELFMNLLAIHHFLCVAGLLSRIRELENCEFTFNQEL